MARTFSFDDGRLACVRAMAGRLKGPAPGDQALAVLKSFSFDDNRLHALRTLVPHCRGLSGDAKKQLVAAFSFSSSREAAALALLD
jgi:hypothetical protein